MKPILIFLLLSPTMYGQTLFDSLLLRNHMIFDAPNGFVATDPIDNQQMNWEAGYTHKKKKFAVRYALRPLDEELLTYEENMRNKQEGDVFTHPNTWYYSLFQATLLNISEGQLPEIGPFPEQAVRDEFNADWGGAAAVPCGSEFAHGYAYTLAVCLHKDDVGDAYIFFMGDDMETIAAEMEAIFHALRFE